ncbi:peptide ABC transporter ATP-binding protein [Pasteurella testudinis]|uniref:peptide ABC transporter ATP-binding protein n=1 Tax=Pasteurella testudinis TaxID=761 RepID=UPI004058CC8A
MALLDIRNLTVEVNTPNGKVKMIDNVNLTVNEGDVCGLIGESGSGKSLVAKIICNSSKPSWNITADRFRFNDVELLKLNPKKRRKLIGKEIAMIFQDPLSCLDPSRKIGKQLRNAIPAFSYKGSGWKWWRWFGWKNRKIVELLHRIGIKDHKDIMNSYPLEITEGEAQKVIVAMAVINQPRLLVADEPTHALEATTQLQVFKLLSSMNQNLNTTILLTSNELKTVSEWCDHFTILYCGQTVESGSKQAILEKPHHPYTVSLLNSIPDFSQPLPLKSHLNTLRGSVPLLNNLPVGCRLGPRCSFAQKKCIQKPPLKRIKQHEFACHFPLNIREHENIQANNKFVPLTIQTDNSEH